MDKLFIPILLGTARDERESEKVAKFVFDQFSKNTKIKTELIDIRNFALSETTPSWVESPIIAEWRETLTKADGLIIVAPEYNHGYPGELKLLIDSALKEYEKKPVAICGVSSSAIGGARMMQHLIPTLSKLGMIPIKDAAYFSVVKELFNQKGKIKNKQKWQKILKKIFDELLWYAKVLKEGRIKYPK